jgi:hypothetical protein
MKVCLVRKLADRVNGIDLATYRVGDVLDLPQHQVEMLVAEGWAVTDRRDIRQPLSGRERRVTIPRDRQPARAADAVRQAKRPK